MTFKKGDEAWNKGMEPDDEHKRNVSLALVALNIRKRLDAKKTDTKG